MPWIREDDCAGCAICVTNCPVGAISISKRIAVIDNRACIRCGRCHDICPRGAVRHDSERIPLDVEANLMWTKDLLRHFNTADERRGLIDRVRRHFAKECKVAEQTIAKLDSMEQQL